MKLTRFAVLFIVTAIACAMPASAQFSDVLFTTPNGTSTTCPSGSGPGLAIDMTTGQVYGCGTNRILTNPLISTGTLLQKTFDTAGTGNVFKSNGTTLAAVTGTIGTYQGTTSTPITDGAFNVLAGPSINVAASGINVAGKTLRVKFSGVYTNAAASLLNVDVAFCTISGCATGTTVAPAGCVVTSTNQANNLTNGQFDGECTFIVGVIGASGTGMAKAVGRFNLGNATSVALSSFADTATAVSAAIDLTVAEFIHPRFKFTTLNAGNSATLHTLTIEVLK